MVDGRLGRTSNERRTSGDMAKFWLQSDSASTGDITEADVYTCRIIVPYAQKLLAADVVVHNLVTTGTVTVSLRRTDLGNSRGGALVGAQLNNTTLEASTAATASMMTKRSFVLGAADTVGAPADREYFLVLSTTDAADRLDEPVLLIQVETT